MRKKKNSVPLIEVSEPKDTTLCFRVSKATSNKLNKICKLHGNTTKVSILESLIAWHYKETAQRKSA